MAKASESDPAMPMLDHLADLSCKQRTQLPASLRFLNRVLVAAFCAVLLGLAFLPWQQFVTANGKVIAFNPLERSVVVEAPLDGRVLEVYVSEGQAVKQGQILCRLADNDPELLTNLQRQLSDLEEQRAAAAARLERIKGQVAQVEKAMPQAIAMAQKQLDAAEFTQKAAELQFERVKSLFEDSRGLASQRDFEVATMNRDKETAEVLKAEAALIKTELDNNAALESLNASMESARSDLKKVDKEANELRSKINQIGRLVVEAPRDGAIVRMQVNEGTFLKSGSPLCTIVPDTKNLVVEMWIDGNDMPLVRERLTDADGKVTRKGSIARLQFEGWPAIQFAGWPSVAIGTFGGEVIFVDKADNGKGMFRVLVEPVPDRITRFDGTEKVVNWPEAPVMRQGVLSQGWILLERVPLWFEMWRQINGFPPVISEDNPIVKQVKSK
ncbi:MAG: Multidrug resistance efflux pump [Verrucomicrobia bacterium]|nr:MAG: Multidrug resistance efflux pump [Verrucomicrobiota bacterium]